MHVGIFDLEDVKVIWGHSVHISQKLGRNSKPAHRRAKQTIMWASGVYNMHVGIFDLEHVKLIWGHLVHFSRNWAITQKRLIIERNERKLGSVYILKKGGHNYNGSS